MVHILGVFKLGLGDQLSDPGRGFVAGLCPVGA